MAGLDAGAVAGRVAPFIAAGLQVHAVGVESFQVFEACVDAGCHAFQGPFRALPALDQAPAVELGAMATAGELLAPDLDTAASRRSSRAISSSATGCCATPTRPSSRAGARSAPCARRSR